MIVFVQYLLILFHSIIKNNKRLLKSFYQGRIFNVLTYFFRIISFFIIKEKIHTVRNLSSKIKFNFFIPLKDQYKHKNPTSLWRVFGIYEPYTSLAIEKYCEKSDVVLELGAAYGYHTIQFSKICSEVHSVEPSDYVEPLLKNNIKINNLKNVKTYKHAIGEHKKKIKVDEKIIEQISLDFFLKNSKISPTIIFIDCDSQELEGKITVHEFEILKMIFTEFKNRKIKIILETKHHSEFKNLINEENNYNFEQISHRHYFIYKDNI
tara:strand:- start:855 stop:1649 length:795 start_codon:yes stop_codon:yes gene_type:complete